MPPWWPSTAQRRPLVAGFLVLGLVLGAQPAAALERQLGSPGECATLSLPMDPPADGPATHAPGSSPAALAANAGTAGRGLPGPGLFDHSIVHADALWPGGAVALVGAALFLALGFMAGRRRWPSPGRQPAAAVEPAEGTGGQGAAQGINLADVVEAADVAIIGADPGGAITAWNVGAERLLGYSAKEMAGRSLFDISPPRHRAEAMELLARALRADVVVDRAVALTRDGREVLVSLSTFPVRDASGRVTGVGSVLRDTGIRVAAERERARLAAMVEASDDAIISRARDGTVLTWNRGAERLLGFQAREMVGTRAEQVLPPDPGLRANEAADTPERDGTRQTETECVTKDGRRLGVAATFFSIPGPGGQVVDVVMLRDISDRQRLERERVQAVNEALRLAEVVHSTNDAILIRDMSGVVTYVNPAFERIIGWPASRIVGIRGLDLAAGDERARMAPLTARALSGEPFEAEIEARGPDGRTLPVRISAFPIRDVDGAQTGIAAIFHDLSEEKRTEHERREAARVSAQLAAIVESSHDAIMSRDMEGRILTWNRAAEQLFGYTAEEMVGMTFEPITPPELREEAAGFSQRALRGEIVRAETERLTKDGRRIAITFSLFTMPGPDGAPAALGIVIHDVSDRKRADAALRESEERYRLLVDTSPYGIAVHQDGLIVFANAAGARLLGANSPEELKGMDIREVLDPVSREIALDRIARMLGGEKGLFPVEQTYVRLDGTTVTVEVTAAPFIHEGRPAVHVVALDITARKKAEAERQHMEAQIQHTQKLESLGVLAGGIAHDFNNLLAGIIGNAGLALNELPPGSAARDTVRDIESAGLRAAELTRQLLAYAGRARFTVEPVNLDGLVNEMAHLLEVSISKKARLVYDFAPGLPAVEGDATQLRQVVMNLITNASDAIGDSPGTITIKTGAMEATREDLLRSYVDGDLPPGTYAFVEVSDTGSGMDQATMDRIFEPFFTTKFTGRGLGMAAVLGIIRSHRGAIIVASEPGRGSTFRVLIPAADGVEAAPVPEAAPAVVTLDGSRALVVDDDDAVRRLTARVLERAGAKVTVAQDGHEAVRLFRAHPGDFDFVVLDLTMPGMDGAETFRVLRAIDPAVRVVLSSGYGEEESLARLESTGAAGFIQKPYRPAELLEMLEKVIRG
ncbi:MAG: PAS domain S-box protein [Dehalococcoidia bacterium]|nr:PAS domain S-box protein [Dehalococcoidia bacterium]